MQTQHTLTKTMSNFFIADNLAVNDDSMQSNLESALNSMRPVLSPCSSH